MIIILYLPHSPSLSYYTHYHCPSACLSLLLFKALCLPSLSFLLSLSLSSRFFHSRSYSVSFSLTHFLSLSLSLSPSLSLFLSLFLSLSFSFSIYPSLSLSLSVLLSLFLRTLFIFCLSYACPFTFSLYGCISPPELQSVHVQIYKMSHRIRHLTCLQRT